MAKSSDYVTSQQAAEIIGVTQGRVKQWVVSGELVPDISHPRFNLFLRSKVAKFAKIPRKAGRPPNKSA